MQTTDPNLSPVLDTLNAILFIKEQDLTNPLMTMHKMEDLMQQLVILMLQFT